MERMIVVVLMIFKNKKFVSSGRSSKVGQKVRRGSKAEEKREALDLRGGGTLMMSSVRSKCFNTEYEHQG